MNIEVYVTFNGTVSTYIGDDEELCPILSGNIRVLHTILTMQGDSTLTKSILGTSLGKVKYYFSLKRGDTVTNIPVTKSQIKQLCQHIINPIDIDHLINSNTTKQC